MLKHPCHASASLLSCKHSLQVLQGGVLTKGISQVSSSFSTHIVAAKTAQSTHADITHQFSNPSTVTHNNAQTSTPCICTPAVMQTLTPISARWSSDEGHQPGIELPQHPLCCREACTVNTHQNTTHQYSNISTVK